MRFLVLGGAGAIGSVSVRDLLRNPHVEEVVVADIDERKGKEFVSKLGDGRASFKRMDVTKEDELAETMKRFDATINSTWYEFNLYVTRAAIKARARLVDLGGLYYMTLKQLELNREAERARASILIGCGEDPGISNVMIKHAADALDEVERIQIRDGDRDLEPAPFVFKFSIRTILDEWTKNAIVFRNGRLEEVPPASGEEEFEFPEPVGKLKVAFSLHSELATIPRYIGKGVKHVDFKINYDFELVHMLRELGFLSAEPVKVGGAEVPARDFTLKILAKHMAGPFLEIEDAACILSRVSGRKDGVSTVITLYALSKSRRDWKVPASSYMTGVPASIAAQMLARGEIGFVGVQPPEACVPTEPFLRELKDRGITIGEKVERIW